MPNERRKEGMASKLNDPMTTQCEYHAQSRYCTIDSLWNPFWQQKMRIARHRGRKLQRDKGGNTQSCSKSLSLGCVCTATGNLDSRNLRSSLLSTSVHDMVTLTRLRAETGVGQQHQERREHGATFSSPPGSQ